MCADLVSHRPTDTTRIRVMPPYSLAQRACLTASCESASILVRAMKVSRPDPTPKAKESQARRAPRTGPSQPNGLVHVGVVPERPASGSTNRYSNVSSGCSITAAYPVMAASIPRRQHPVHGHRDLERRQHCRDRPHSQRRLRQGPARAAPSAGARTGSLGHRCRQRSHLRSAPSLLTAAAVERAPERGSPSTRPGRATSDVLRRSLPPLAAPARCPHTANPGLSTHRNGRSERPSRARYPRVDPAHSRR